MINLKKRAKAREILQDIEEKPDNVFLIHYSCESFYERIDLHSPMITSIAIRNLATRQAHSFSIHQVAEEHDKLNCIKENYPLLEKKMLDKFFLFIHEHKNHKWVHWNMRDSNYGFGALEHRYRVLGGNPDVIEDNLKFDLSSLLIDIYTANYINHPRLECLIEKNAISKNNFLTGKDEAIAFQEEDYLKLHQSTLIKTDIFANIIERVYNNQLKTNLTWRNLQGSRAIYFATWFNKNPIITFLIAISGWIFGLISFILK